MASLFGLARLGRDAEIRYMPDGKAVANLSLAFSYGRKGDDGKRPTQWVDGALFGKMAESLAPYLLKGSMVSVTVDDIHIETYQGKNGEGHKLTGYVTKVEFAGGGNKTESTSQPVAPVPPPQAAPKPAPNFNDMDDDIPF